MPNPPQRCPPCPPAAGAFTSTPATSYVRRCAACGAEIWHFPEDHGPGTDVRVEADALSAARAGAVAALDAPVRAALEAGWWVEPRQWALHLEAIHPELARWRALFDYGPAKLRDGVAGLIAERAAQATVAAPRPLTFAETTTALPPGARRMAPGLCNPGARSGDALVVSARGPTAADPGPLCRWRRGEAPTVVRPAGFHFPLGGELWSEEVGDAVVLLRVPPSGPAEVLARFAARHLSAFGLPDGSIELRATGGPAGDATPVEVRDTRGRLLRRGGPSVASHPERPNPPPFDDGYARRIVPDGHCYARNAQIVFAPSGDEGAGTTPWEVEGGFEWVGSSRVFLLRTLTSTPSLCVVDAVTGVRSTPLSTPHPPARFVGLCLPGGDDVVVVADARFALLSPRTRVPVWRPLPYAGELVLGEAFGRRVVLAARDEIARHLVIDVGAGVDEGPVGEVTGMTPVRSGGHGPVFLGDDRWGVVHWPEE